MSDDVPWWRWRPPPAYDIPARVLMVAGVLIGVVTQPHLEWALFGLCVTLVGVFVFFLGWLATRSQ